MRTERRAMQLSSRSAATLALLLHLVIPGDAPGLINVGALDTPAFALDVEVVGSLAYVADERSGLRVMDVSNPAAPVELGALDTPGYAMDVEVVGSLAYVADHYSGLRVLDPIKNVGVVLYPVEDDPPHKESIGPTADVSVNSTRLGLHVSDRITCYIVPLCANGNVRACA